MVLIKSMYLKECCDYLNICPLAQKSVPDYRFIGDLSPRTLETGDVGVALVIIQSNLVNVTFVSDGSVGKEGFELQVFPFYRIVKVLLNLFVYSM